MPNVDEFGGSYLDYAPDPYKGGSGPAPGSFRAAQEVGIADSGFDFQGTLGTVTDVIDAGSRAYANIAGTRASSRIARGKEVLQPLSLSTASGTPDASGPGPSLLGGIDLTTIALVFGGLFLLSRVMD